MNEKVQYDQNLFSYGTLLKEAVQLETFGRKLEGTPEQLLGYRLSTVEIKDEDVIKTSGERFHPILFPCGVASEPVDGVVFRISKEELAQADEYEVSEYQRVLGKCKSGKETWVYVAAEDGINKE